MAPAHHMITVIYQILSRSEVYIELGGDYYDLRNKTKVVARLVQRLSRLGYYAELRLIGPTQGIDTPSVPETSRALPEVSEPDSNHRNPSAAQGGADRASVESEELSVDMPPL